MIARNAPGPEQNENQIEGRQAVREALRSGATVEKILIADGCHDGPVETIRREAKKQDVVVRYVSQQRLDQISATKRHQGVIAYVASFSYASLEEVLWRAEDKNEKPFIIILNNIEDPHNLGAIIRTANVCGAHGVVIPKDRSAHLTATVARASAGALLHTPVVRVTNVTDTIRELQNKGLWFVCADMDGKPMYELDLRGPIGLVVGNEGAGVGVRVKKQCDMTARIPMFGEVESLNASVAAGVLAYEIVRQRRG